MKLLIQKGDRIYNMYEPLYNYIHFSKKLNIPDEYIVLETNDNNVLTLLLKIKDNSIIHYGIIDDERWQRKQISLFDNL
jgi:hypothetical protein